MNRRTWLLAALAATALTAAPASVPASAQSPAPAQRPTNLRGTVDSVGKGSMQMTTREGDKARVDLPANTRVSFTVPAKASDIKANDWVGCTSIDRDGKSYAVEIHIFPAAGRGVGAGSRPYDLQPDSTMTNGAVGTVTGTQHQTITLSYDGGQKTLLVTPETEVVTTAPASLADIKPGAHVLVNATKTADGSWTPRYVNVGKGGSTPPM